MKSLFARAFSPLKSRVAEWCQKNPRWAAVCQVMRAWSHRLAVDRPSPPMLSNAVYSDSALLGWWQEQVTLRDIDYVQAESALRCAPGARAHRLFAFYLPQFHSFNENDAWWGAGFTEWTNVTKAFPRFIGHDQPRWPADLGFYDLSCEKTLRAQADLARQFGVDGFCVYCYWFDGKPLMDAPVQLWKRTNDLELPLFLCWANENWTRRWDGLEHEVLIAQRHSANDDLAFIDYALDYMSDRRYVQIDGKPVLLVYYLTLLPDPKATAERWRERARSRIGKEIMLLCVHSKDAPDPVAVGFDGAVEFPPVGLGPVPKADNVVTAPGFRGGLYNYSRYVAEQLNKVSHGERPVKFRCVMPGWDNTARRGSEASVFTGQSPELFQRWLHEAIRDTRWRKKPENQVVFVNAWNEWAEGAYLEPDRRHGFAYLQALAKATDAWSQPCLEVVHEGVLGHPHAVLIHAYYPELLTDFEQAIKDSGLQADLWVTVVNDSAAREALSLWPDARVMRVPNLGRDIAPFLSVLPSLLDHPYRAAIKLHTKKSLHRLDGSLWRQYLIKNLLPGPAEVTQVLQRFDEDPSLSLVAPDGHLPPLRPFKGGNLGWLERLCDRYNVPRVDQSQAFVAGSMFWFRPSAFLGFSQDPLQCGDFFMDVSGEIDGTLAHGLERFFLPYVESRGFYASDMSTILAGAPLYEPGSWSGFLGTGEP